jgi:hypothetical protein
MVMATLLIIFLMALAVCCVPFRDYDDDLEEPAKTCNDCALFAGCDMWNNSFVPCAEWEEENG